MSAVEPLEPAGGLPDSARIAAAPQRQRPALRLLAPATRLAPSRLARFPFVLMLLGILAVGMAGLVLLNTQIQTQASDLAALQRQATELHQQRSQLQAEVNQRRSATHLQQEAHRLGLRPNPHPAFIVLPSGRIIGKPTPVTGKELPDQTYIDWRTSADAQEEARAAVAREKAEAERKAREARQRAAEEKKQQSTAPSTQPSATAPNPSAATPSSLAPQPSTRPSLVLRGNRGGR